jgi:PAS domain S-box-containing protein
MPLFSSANASPTPEKAGHVVQLYTDETFLLDTVAHFIGEALAAGDSALALATKPHLEALTDKLKSRGVITAAAIQEGRLIVLDARQVLTRCLVNGTIDEAVFAKTIGEALTAAHKGSTRPHSPIAAFGELVALLWADGKFEEAIRLEKLWNSLGKQYSFSLLCAYPITCFDSEKHIAPFQAMCAQHSAVMPSEAYSELNSEKERLHSVANLQQRAQILHNKLALQQTEERFRLFVEAVQEYAIFMLDPAGHITSWNAGAERMSGYNSDEVIGKHFSCFYPPEEVLSGTPLKELNQAAREGRFEEDGWRIRKDGSRFWANVIITPLQDTSGNLIGFGKVTRDFTERMLSQDALTREVADRRQAEKRLYTSEQYLRELSLHLLRTQDEERRRIGQDLHDSLGQYLAVLKMKLDLLAALVESGDGRATATEIAQCGRLIDDAIKEVRTISYLLYPPMLEEMGLPSAIPWYLNGFAQRSGIRTSFEVHGDLGRLPQDAELAMFRVLQESLTNVHRHSGSQTAHVRLMIRDGMVILEVRDQGKGVPAERLRNAGQDWVSSLGVGLRGMNERIVQLGGKLDLFSTDKGTTVTAVLPIEDIT